MYFFFIVSILNSTPASTPAEKSTAPAAKTSVNVAKATPAKPTSTEVKNEPPSPADKLVAEAFSTPPEPAKQTVAPAVPESSSSGNLWLPALALLALAATALILTRRKQNLGGMVKILETAQLGPRRSLIVAQVQGETMLLACSEAGISVLSNNLRPPDMILGVAPSDSNSPAGKSPTSLRAAWNAIFTPTQQRGATATFEQSLTEATAAQTTGEDEDLRAKLAVGLRGRKS